MKKIVLILSFIILFAGCSKEDDSAPLSGQIVGRWSLSEYTPSTKSIIIGGQTVTVSITFTADNRFQMVQKIGKDAYEEYFEGTYLIQGNILSGTYSDKSVWGTSYVVEIKGDNTLTMTSSIGDIFVYSRVR